MVKPATGRAPIDRAALHKLLDRLCDLRERTDPATCDRPDEVPVVGELRGKENAAHWAVMMMDRLVRQVAGWAIDHRLGRALDPDVADPDSHEHERVGAGLFGFGVDLAPDDARALLIEWIKCHRDSVPAGLKVDITEALAALRLGEVQPILRPNVTGRRGNAATLAQVQMEAIGYIAYRHASGLRFREAVAEIAGTLGVSASALNTWQYRTLPEVLGKGEVARHIEIAKRAGEVAALLRRDRDYASVDKGRNETLDLVALMARDYYDALSLDELRDRYRAALRAANAAGDSQIIR
jgi:hypothetical protein